MTDLLTPGTEAGRWLLDHQELVNISKPAQHSMRGDEIDLRAAIITIEQEARADTAALAAAIRNIPIDGPYYVEEDSYLSGFTNGLEAAARLAAGEDTDATD